MSTIDGAIDRARGSVSAWLASLLRRALTWQGLAFISIVLGLYAFVGILTFTGERGVFTSPDETGSYLITQAFAETGQLYYERDYFAEDDLGIAHARSLLRYEDRVVLPNSQGLPLFYGAAHAVFGDSASLVILLLAPLSLVFLYETAALILKRRSLALAIAFFGLGPLLYWFSRPYWNSLGATAFFLAAGYFVARYYQSTRRADLVCAGVLFSASMLFRYEYAAFVVPLMAIIALQRHGLARWRDAARDLAVFGGVIIGLFLVPVMALSLFIYDEFIVFPTALLGESVDDAGPNTLVRGLDLAWSALLPEGFDPLLVGRNLVRFTIVLVPALTLLGATGFVLALRRGVLRVWQVLPFGALLVYYLFFVGSVDDTFLASGWEISFEASIVRYWLLFYVVLYFFAAYALLAAPDLLRSAWPRISPRIADAAPVALAIVLAASTVPVVWFSWSGSLSFVQDGQAFGAELSEEVESRTEPDAVVYSPGELHKFIGGARDVVALPEPVAVAADPDLANAVAHQIQQVMDYRPVYFMRRGVLTGEPYLEEVLDGLERRGLTLEPLDIVGSLNRVVPTPGGT